MVGKCKSFCLVLISGRFFIVWLLHKRLAIKSSVSIAIGLFTRFYCLFWRKYLTRFFDFLLLRSMRRMIIRVNHRCYFRNNDADIGPSMGVFFRENSCSLEIDFERADLWKDNILVGVNVDVFILCNLERDKIARDHISHNFYWRKALCDEFGNWVEYWIHLRKVSWYLISSWCVHQLWVSHDRQYST